MISFVYITNPYDFQKDITSLNLFIAKVYPSLYTYMYRYLGKNTNHNKKNHSFINIPSDFITFLESFGLFLILKKV